MSNGSLKAYGRVMCKISVFDRSCNFVGIVRDMFEILSSLSVRLIQNNYNLR